MASKESLGMLDVYASRIVDIRIVFDVDTFDEKYIPVFLRYTVGGIQISRREG